MRKVVFVICLLNLFLVLGVILYYQNIFRVMGASGGFTVIWSVVMASMLVFLSCFGLKDQEVLEGILDHLDRSSVSRGA